VQNLRFLQNNISSAVAKGDLAQPGKLEDIMNPGDYVLQTIKR